MPKPQTACFNTQPPEGGWVDKRNGILVRCIVSTHSRPKAAGPLNVAWLCLTVVSTHSRPKAAGCVKTRLYIPPIVSTHSRPKAAGCLVDHFEKKKRCFNTQPPEGGWFGACKRARKGRRFQHTAARRRLERRIKIKRRIKRFQHTAARRRLAIGDLYKTVDI